MSKYGARMRGLEGQSIPGSSRRSKTPAWTAEEDRALVDAVHSGDAWKTDLSSSSTTGQPTNPTSSQSNLSSLHPSTNRPLPNSSRSNSCSPPSSANPDPCSTRQKPHHLPAGSGSGSAAMAADGALDGTGSDASPRAAFVDIHQRKQINWRRVAEIVTHARLGPPRDADQCFQRWGRVLCPTIRKGAWDAAEDLLLDQAVERFGPTAWTAIARTIPGRTDIQCRSRWFQRQHTMAKRRKAAHIPDAEPKMTFVNGYIDEQMMSESLAPKPIIPAREIVHVQTEQEPLLTTGARHLPFQTSNLAPWGEISVMPQQNMSPSAPSVKVGQSRVLEFQYDSMCAPMLVELAIQCSQQQQLQRGPQQSKLTFENSEMTIRPSYQGSALSPSLKAPERVGHTVLSWSQSDSQQEHTEKKRRISPTSDRQSKDSSPTRTEESGGVHHKMSLASILN
eukprot:TRINITY_DN8488_c0_g1_i4.p1 TRINITY_DN8488_c0_g1~~TRINITY_DN8488_c0_g1_i4.p1  ORF type:complete len:450 (+),score=75.64 TRINITY_DN8488_c0_g1_i4:136-1485(+)